MCIGPDSLTKSAFFVTISMLSIIGNTSFNEHQPKLFDKSVDFIHLPGFRLIFNNKLVSFNGCRAV